MSQKFVYVVRVKIPVSEEDEWNRWHNEEHIPHVLSLPGFIQVHKYRMVGNVSSSEVEYFVLYELRNQSAYQSYVQSDEGARLRQEYLDAYGPITKIVRWVWQETLHLVK